MESRTADAARAHLLARMRAMPPAQRVDLALQLGHEAASAFAKANGLTVARAARELDARAARARKASSATRSDA